MVRSEITVRSKKYNDIISTLGKCTQIMQNQMLQLGAFVKPLKDRTEQ